MHKISYISRDGKRCCPHCHQPSIVLVKGKCTYRHCNNCGYLLEEVKLNPDKKTWEEVTSSFVPISVGD